MRITFFLAVASLAAGPLLAATAAQSIRVDAAWVRSVPPVTNTTAAYMTLTNTDTADHMLVNASSSIAGNIELHRNSSVDGMMRMRHIPHVHIPAGKTVTLGSGGMHLMVFRLKQPPVTGEAIGFTLEFADGSHQKITAEVK